MKKQFIIIFLILIIFTSCKEKYDFTNCRDASDAVLEGFSNCKIMFFGEKHNDIIPTLFLRDNLKKLYDEGLRYIFFEGDSDNYIDNSNKYSFSIYPAWGNWGYRYERTFLYDEINKINIEHSDDQIKVYWPENGLRSSDYPDLDDVEWRNLRDYTAQSNIKAVMDESEINQKGIIFYGEAHGLKFEERWWGESMDYKPLGVYLDEYYGEQFVNCDFFNIVSNKERDVTYKNESVCIIPEEFQLKKLLNGTERRMDFYCFYPKEICGVPSFYISNKSCINFMAKIISNKSLTEFWIEEDDVLLSIYYLKYLLDENFEYDLKSNKIEKLSYENIQFDVNNELRNLEEYFYYLDYGEIIINYLYYPKKDYRINLIINNMKKAKELNSKDIWPDYWICYFNTEIAKYSGKKEDYKKAIELWKNLLDQELIYYSPILKLCYEKIIFCNEKIKNESEVKLYEDLMNKNCLGVYPEYSNFIYYGYM